MSTAVAVAAGYLAHLVPHVYHYKGIPVGDVGPPVIELSRFLEHGSGYSVATDGLVSYPFVTQLILSPFLLVPLSWIIPVFWGISSGLLSYAILSKGQPWQLLMMVSVQYMSAMYSVQWSPIVTAAFLLSPLLPISIAKPQLAIGAIVAGKWTWRTATFAFSLVALSFLIYPSWLFDWLSRGGFGSYLGRIPLLTGPGIVLAVAAMFWREPESRLLLAMGLVPQRVWYDQLLLFLIPRSWRSLALLVAFSWLMIFATPVSDLAKADQSLEAWLSSMWLFYLPTLGIFIWERRSCFAGHFTTFMRAKLKVKR